MADFIPNHNNIVDAAKNIKPGRFPLYEHGISFDLMETILERQFAHLLDSQKPGDLYEFHKCHSDFYKLMGYDTVTWELGITSILPDGGALGGHQPGVIKTREDFEKYPWDTLERKYFERWSLHFKVLRDVMPEGMKAIGGPGNGVFECVQDLTGYQQLCLLFADDPELYKQLFEKMGEVNYGIWERFMREFGDIYCVLRFGDDLGYKGATLLSPEHIKKFIIPQYKKIVDLVHSYNKPFLLHCCGNIFSVMDDLIDVAGIDAKHSNEDVIAPFYVWIEKYGDRIGNFGGIDMDVLCRNDPEQIKAYTLDVLKSSTDSGGVAFGSGNSIPDYVPLESYLEMVKTVREFRGE